MSERRSRSRRRRGTVAPPKSGGAPHLSKREVGTVALVALIAVAAVYYDVDRSSAAYTSETVIVQIAAPFVNSTSNIASAYYPAIIPVEQGAHVSLQVENTDPNVAHGLAVPQFKVDTGPIQPLGSVRLSFVADAVGHFAYDEPSADCGGDNCDSGQSLAGVIVVLAP